MKKIIATFITVAALTTINVNAQCKFKTNESDPFTSEKHLVSKNIRLNGDMKSANESKFFAITNLEKKGKTYRWNFEFYERALRDKNSLKPMKLKIKTKSGVLELSSDVIPDPKFTLEENAQMTELDFHFDLSAEQIQQLQSGVDIVGIDIFGESKLFKTNSLEDIGPYAKCIQE